MLLIIIEYLLQQRVKTNPTRLSQVLWMGLSLMKLQEPSEIQPPGQTERHLPQKPATQILGQWYWHVKIWDLLDPQNPANAQNKVIYKIKILKLKYCSSGYEIAQIVCRSEA